MIMMYTASVILFIFYSLFEQVHKGRHLERVSLDDGQRLLGIQSKNYQRTLYYFLNRRKIMKGNKGKPFLPMLKSGAERQLNKRMKEGCCVRGRSWGDAGLGF